MKKYILMFVVIIIVASIAVFANSQKPINETKQHSQEAHTNNTTTHVDHAALVTDDKSFIQGMIPHHEEAITSSEELLTVAETPELRTLASEIIAAQKMEVEQMKTWHQEWFGEPYKDNGKYQPMMRSVKGEKVMDAEMNYMRGMIIHHYAAVDMAKAIQPKTKRPEIKEMANNIVTTQTEETKELYELLEGGGHNQH